MICCMRADRKRQSVAIDYRHDFHAFSAFGEPDFCSAAFGHDEGCVDEAFPLVQDASLAKIVGQINQNAPQNVVATPSLKTPMHGFVVRVALWQHMPLCTRVQNP